jgi:predicted acyltransferase (DUF342 family)
MIRRPLVLALALVLSTAALAHDPQEQGADRSRVMGGLSADKGETVGDLDTVNGGISIDDGAHAGELSTVNGGIDIDDDAVVAEASTVNGGIEVGERVRIERDLETVNGGISVDFNSRVGGDVATVNGGITVRQTEVGGQIRLVNGDIMVGAKSHVRGGIHVEKNKGVQFGWGSRKPRVPRVIIGPNAIVDGELRFERDVQLYVHTSAKIGKVIGATVLPYTDTIPPRD